MVVSRRRATYKDQLNVYLQVLADKMTDDEGSFRKFQRFEEKIRQWYLVAVEKGLVTQ